MWENFKQRFREFWRRVFSNAREMLIDTAKAVARRIMDSEQYDRFMEGVANGIQKFGDLVQEITGDAELA